MAYFGLYYRYAYLNHIEDDSFEWVKMELRRIQDEGLGFAQCIVNSEGVIFVIGHEGISDDVRDEELVKTIESLKLPVDLSDVQFETLKIDY